MAYTDSSNFAKMFCKKSPFKQKTIGQMRRQERELRRNDKRDQKILESGGDMPYEGNLPWFK